MNYYVGNPLQIRGAEEYVLKQGKGDGMRFVFVRNGLGLEAFISVDRCGDLSRVTFKGDNMGFFAPCGYVAPQYYDNKGAGFLKSFTAGFFTTCGLTAVGSPCVDEGEELPLHGTISNTPARLAGIEETEEYVKVKLEVLDAALFGRKLLLNREYTFSYTENSIEVVDTVTNLADETSPYMIMYHCNMGAPLLSENAEVVIPNNGVTPRNDHAKEFIDTALNMEKPQSGYEECCYYYDVLEQDGIAKAGIFNSDIDKGVVLAWEKKGLGCFTEWKMMGKTDYVLGLEPANCTPDGRDVLRKEGRLKFLDSGESGTTKLKFIFADNKAKFGGQF